MVPLATSISRKLPGDRLVAGLTLVLLPLDGNEAGDSEGRLRVVTGRWPLFSFSARPLPVLVPLKMLMTVPLLTVPTLRSRVLAA